MKQITIVDQDRPGLLSDISELLGSAGVNIESIEAESVDATAVITLIVDKYDEALRALTVSPFNAISEDAIVVRVPDKPGELALLMKRFKDANISLRSLVILKHDAGHAFVALSTHNNLESQNLVRDILVG